MMGARQHVGNGEAARLERRLDRLLDFGLYAPLVVGAVALVIAFGTMILKGLAF